MCLDCLDIDVSAEIRSPKEWAVFGSGQAKLIGLLSLHLQHVWRAIQCGHFTRSSDLRDLRVRSSSVCCWAITETLPQCEHHTVHTHIPILLCPSWTLRRTVCPSSAQRLQRQRRTQGHRDFDHHNLMCWKLYSKGPSTSSSPSVPGYTCKVIPNL